MKLIQAYIRHRTFVECEGTGQYPDQEKEHICTKYQFADAYRE